MDGDPVKEVFTTESAPAERDVAERDPLTEQGEERHDLDDEVEERLEQIGYLE